MRSPLDGIGSVSTGHYPGDRASAFSSVAAVNTAAAGVSPAAASSSSATPQDVATQDVTTQAMQQVVQNTMKTHNKKKVIT